MRIQRELGLQSSYIRETLLEIKVEVQEKEGGRRRKKKISPLSTSLWCLRHCPLVTGKSVLVQFILGSITAHYGIRSDLNTSIAKKLDRQSGDSLILRFYRLTKICQHTVTMPIYSKQSLPLQGRRRQVIMSKQYGMGVQVVIASPCNMCAQHRTPSALLPRSFSLSLSRLSA